MLTYIVLLQVLVGSWDRMTSMDSPSGVSHSNFVDWMLFCCIQIWPFLVARYFLVDEGNVEDRTGVEVALFDGSN